MVWRARLRQAIDATDKGDKAIAAEAGIAAETLSRLLRSDQEPGLETMRRLASATGVSVGWLLGEEPFSRADDERLRDIISYLEPKKVPESPRIESNAVAVRDAAPQAITRRKPRPAQATPDVEQEPEGAAVRPLRQGGEDRVPYRAQGDSMTDAAILDGDLLYVRKIRSGDDAEGKIVVCKVDGSIYVKRYFFRHRRPELHSENRAYSPMIVDASQRFEIIGIVVKVVRELRN